MAAVRSSSLSANGNNSPPASGVRSPDAKNAATRSPSSGGAGYVSLGWEIVRPAGTGPADWMSAISKSVSEIDDVGRDSTGRQLESGIQRSSLQTGPKNLLVLPPDIASVVYVVDCSSSMNGGKFDRVQAAIADAISQMKPDQQFALLLFNTSAMQIRGGGYRQAGAVGASELQQELSMIAPEVGRAFGFKSTSASLRQVIEDEMRLLVDDQIIEMRNERLYLKVETVEPSI